MNQPAATSITGKSGGINKTRIYKWLVDYLVIIAILILGVITAIRVPSFLTFTNLLNITRQMASLGIISLGMTVAIIGGYTDLSVSGLFSLVAMVVAKNSQVTNTWVAILIGLLVGLLCGTLNGALLLLFGARTRSDALFITYGMSIIYINACLLYDASTINITDDPVISLIGRGSLGPIPYSIIILLVCVAIMQFVLTKTVAGRSIYLIGGNQEVARLNGIKIKKNIILMFMLVGLFTALAAIVQSARITAISSQVGRNYDTNAIMACVVGGTSFTGGRGGALNTLFGTLLICMMSNSLNLLGFNSNLQFAIRGSILIAVIWLDAYKEKREATA